MRPSLLLRLRSTQLLLTPLYPILTDAAIGLGGEDGHLTVALDNLRHLSLNGTMATFGSGNHLGDVALFPWENGKHSGLVSRARRSSMGSEPPPLPTRTQR